MILKKLSVLNYKNILQSEVIFSPKMNCFFGNNGMGKTNLLDAIHYLSFCKSHVNTPDRDVYKRQYVPCVFLQRLSISVERKRMYISVSLSRRKRSPPSRKTRILPSSCINVHMVLKNKKRPIESVINSGSLN